MSFVEHYREVIPDWAKDIRLNLDAVINRGGLDLVDAYGCALSAAFANGNTHMQNRILEDGILDDVHIKAALGAASLMGMNNVWYPYVEMTEDANLRGLPAGLRMNIYATHGGVSKREFEMYALAASIVGKCHFCVKSHYDVLKTEGMDVQQLATVGKIAAVITSISKMPLA